MQLSGMQVSVPVHPAFVNGLHVVIVAQIEGVSGGPPLL
jgi:hypothetical protein